jgi:hypothetical protein
MDMPAAAKAHGHHGAKQTEKEKQAEHEQTHPSAGLNKPDPYLAGMRCKPLANAFVAITPHLGSKGEATYWKTNEKGRLIRFNRQSPDGDPVDDTGHSTLGHLMGGTTYDVFWTYDRKLFIQGAEFIGTRSQLTTLGFFELTLAPLTFDRQAFVDLLPPSPAGSAHHHSDQYKLAFLMHNLGRKGIGYFSMFDLTRANRKPQNEEVNFWMPGRSEDFEGDFTLDAWAFARRPAIAAIFFTEYLTQFVGRVQTASAWEYDQMESVRTIVAAAKNGERVPEMDEQILGRPATKDAPKIKGNYFGEEYWRWAFECGTASNGDLGRRAYVSPETFEATLYSVFGWQGQWREEATKIKETFGVVHPSFDLARPASLDPNAPMFKPLYTKDSVMAYFDFYQFGVQQEDPGCKRYHNGWMNHVEPARKRIEETIDRLVEIAYNTMHVYADCYKAWSDIGWHVTGNDARDMMQRRYLDACGDVGFDWWCGAPAVTTEHEKEHEPEEPESEKEREPERPESKKEFEGLKAVMNLGFITAAKQADLLEQFFAWRSRTMMKRIGKSMRQVRDTLRKFKSIDRAFIQSKLEKIRPDDIRLETKWKVPIQSKDVERQGTVSVFKGQEKVGEFEIRRMESSHKRAEIVEPGKAPGHHGSGAAPHGGDAEEVVDWGHKPRGFKLERDPKAVMEVPQWVSGLAYFALIGAELYAILHERSEDRHWGEFAIKVAPNMGLMVYSFSEAMELTFARAAAQSATFPGAPAPWITRAFTHQSIERFGGFGRLVLKGAIALEMINVTREGALIFLENEPGYAGELGHGRRALALKAKGCVLLGGAGLSFAAAVALGIAAGGPVLAAVGIVTAAIDLAAWIWGERESSMDEIEERLIKAIEREFGSDYVSTASTRYPVCRVVARLEHFISGIKALDEAVLKVDGLTYDPHHHAAAK